MAISTYAELVTAIGEWLARENDATLVARVPDFITLCEAKLNRKLFHSRMETRSYAIFTLANDEPEFVSLPSDFQTMRRIRLSSVTGKPVLDYKSHYQLDEYRQSIANATGQPKYYTVFGSEIEFAPTPDDDYTIEMVYRANLSALTSGNTTNWLLTLAPDLYLYGSLMESAPYIKEDERLAVWSAGYTTALNDLNQHSMNQQFGAQPLQMTAYGYTP